MGLHGLSQVGKTGLYSGGVWFESRPGTPNILTEDIVEIPQFFQPNARIIA
jgi:hypothetical protein